MSLNELVDVLLALKRLAAEPSLNLTTGTDVEGFVRLWQMKDVELDIIAVVEGNITGISTFETVKFYYNTVNVQLDRWARKKERTKERKVDVEKKEWKGERKMEGRQQKEEERWIEERVTMMERKE